MFEQISPPSEWYTAVMRVRRTEMKYGGAKCRKKRGKRKIYDIHQKPKTKKQT